MAALEFKLPDIGEGVSEGEIVRWHVTEGDEVAEDAPLVEVMTDKATVVIDSPVGGRVARLAFAVGETARVGDVLAVIEAAGGATTAREATAAREDPAPSSRVDGDEGPAATAVGVIESRLPGAELLASAEAATNAPATRASPTGRASHFDPKPLATPAVRALARERGVDLREVPPTGPRGRVSRDDVLAAAAGQRPSGGAHVAQRARQPGGEALRREHRRETREPFVGVRRKIAERMAEATRTAAQFTFVEELDAEPLMRLREHLAAGAQARGVKLTYLPFIVKATALVLRRHPALNSTLDEKTHELVYRHYYDIGVATATDAGLMVPVVRGADELGLLALAAEIERLSAGAREGTLGRDELTGSTFTVTSLGRQGGLLATPVLNHPEVGILGVHRIRARPVVRDGAIVVGQVGLLSLTFDHRVVDGHVGAAFAYDLIDELEHPERMFIDRL
ncbi:MAG: 2-oxo acid dehydrogenase subunit E2 [Myxococcales bacterium]|nr:2-oxo acid dehydrogenase subunit E2 [Myxococcales bacterium]